jgi:hypothetical protein
MTETPQHAAARVFRTSHRVHIVHPSEYYIDLLPDLALRRSSVSRSLTMPVIDLHQTVLGRRLRFVRCAPSMSTMLRSKTTRRLIAGVLGTVLALCQSLAVANACTLAASSSSLGAVEEACHDFASDEDRTVYESAPQVPCGAQQISIPSANAIMPVVTPSPVIITRTDPSPIVTSYVLPVDYAQACAAPLPLTLIHCRLLI